MCYYKYTVMLPNVTGPTRREACRSICRLLLLDMVKITVRVEQMANRYSWGQAEE